jgi:hypothetical protein
MSTVDRFKEKQIKDAATKEQLDHVESIKKMISIQPDNPVWALALPIQEVFAQAEYRDQHGAYAVTFAKGEDGSNAVVWNSKVRGVQEPFLSVQATPRVAPRAAQIAPPDVLDEFLYMIEDINQNDKGASAALIRAAVLSFKALLVTVLDGDPATNHYFIQAYTQDRKYLMDIQVYYDVIQDDIEHQG